MSDRPGRDKTAAAHAARRGGEAGPAGTGDAVASRNGAARPLSRLLPRIVRPAFGRRPAAQATLFADWTTVAGPGLAAVATPVRLSGGVLLLGCDGPTALELQHREALLVQRINLSLGGDVVRRIRLVQSGAPAPSGAPATAAPPRRRARSAEALPAVAGAPDGPLGEALARLRAAMEGSRGA